MEQNRKDFIRWLEHDLTHFVALIEEGSTATKDPFQKGFSDHDITIVVRSDVKSEMRAVYTWLEQCPFNDTYLFGPRLLDSFLLGDSLNDLSLKFRSQVIAGKDVVREKKYPSREKSFVIGSEGLQNLRVRCERRWLNLAHWSEQYAQKKNYEIFKNFFMFAAARLYGETGEYPIRRVDVAKQLEQSSGVENILYVVNNIGVATKEEQKNAFESAIAFVDSKITHT